MTFEDLDAWKKARTLVSGIYALTREPALAGFWALRTDSTSGGFSDVNMRRASRERTGQRSSKPTISRGRPCGEVRSLVYVIEDNYRPSGQALGRFGA